MQIVFNEYVVNIPLLQHAQQSIRNWKIVWQIDILKDCGICKQLGENEETVSPIIVMTRRKVKLLVKS